MEKTEEKTEKKNELELDITKIVLDIYDDQNNPVFLTQKTAFLV
jgi:hypothetical protein